MFLTTPPHPHLPHTHHHLSSTNIFIVDIFIVNSFSSLSQALFVFLLLPVQLSLRGLQMQDLPSFLENGARCFAGLTPACGGDCTGAPLLPALYVGINLLFNIAILNFLRTNGALTTSLLGSLVVPLTIFAFTFDLPLVGAAGPLGSSFVLGVLVLVVGLVLYNVGGKKQLSGGGGNSGAPSRVGGGNKMKNR